MAAELVIKVEGDAAPAERPAPPAPVAPPAAERAAAPLAGRPPGAPAPAPRPDDLRPNAALDEAFGIPPPAPGPTAPRDDGLAAEPAWDRVLPRARPAAVEIPRANPAGGPGTRMPTGESLNDIVSVFVVGPRPLPVTIVGEGRANPAPAAAPKSDPNTQSLAAEVRAMRMVGAAAQVGRDAGGAVVGVAKGSVMPALAGAADIAAVALSRLGPAGVAGAAAIKMFAEGVQAVRATIDALVARGRELSGFNANLAAASARADLRQLQGNIAEANRTGEQLSRLIDAQSRADAVQQRILSDIKVLLAEKLANLIENGVQHLVGILEVLNSMPGMFNGRFTELLRDLKGILADDSDMSSLVDKWARGMGGAGPAPVAAPPTPAPLGIPLT